MQFTNTNSSSGHVVSVELPVANRRESLLAAFMWLLIALAQISFSIGSSDSFQRIGSMIIGSAYILISFINIWQALASHRLSVSPEELTFERRAMGLHKSQRYNLHEISNLRVAERRVFIGRHWVLAFDRKGKHEFIATQLISPVSQGLLEPIYAHFPQIAPGSVDVDQLSSVR